MAFEATHVRFARDLKPFLKVTNEADYYAGCVYPDSRYVTGISREETHTEIPLNLSLSDFEKGWFTHLVYDRTVSKDYLKNTPWEGVPVKGLGEHWQQMTAAKLVEDQLSYDLLQDDVAILKTLAAPKTPPRNEDAPALERYYAKLRELYQHKPSLEDYYDLLTLFHVPEAAAKSVLDATTYNLSEPMRFQAIQGIYDPGLARATNEIRALLGVAS